MISAHQRIPRIRAGALVVERLLHHLVEGVEEIFLIDAVLLDGLLDAYLGFQLFNGGQQVLELLLVVPALDAEEIGAFHVPLEGVRILVLREGAHLGGTVARIEAP